MNDQEEKTSSSFFKSKIGLVFIFFIIATLISLISIWYYHIRQYVWTNDAYIEAFSVQLSSDIEARIIYLCVDEGDFVKKGQLICQLDTSILNARKQEAKTNIELLEKQIIVRKFQMEKMQEIYSVAKNEFENAIISFLDYEKIQKNYQISQASYELAKADLENGIAKLELINEWLCHTKVFAPRDGMIAKRWVLAGDVVQIGQPLFTLYDLKDVWITARLEETKLENVQIGSFVKIHVDTYPDREFTGDVFVIKSAAASQFSLIPPQNATGNFTKVVQRIPIKIHLYVPEKDPNLYLFPGMSTEVKIKVR
jgi:membrane fusion protein, multidrug efflux system